ncbi:hypothetical protein GGR55DRAFT_687821 [Xylaria sp. FL0064]|nr:hypothetical protein GGR55DRAFT_687821 [Xylaria sp. FL0064]
MATLWLRQVAFDPSRAADDDRGYIIASTIPCMVLSFIAVVLRLASRRIKRSRLLVSDYLAITGLICAWVLSLLVIEGKFGTRSGLGLHIEQVSLASIRQILIELFISELFYTIGFIAIKLSIITLYRQLFPTRLMLFSTMLLAIFVILWGIALLLVTIFSCTPVHGFWDIDVPSKCVNSKWFFIGNAIPNILADLLLLILPIRDVWKLQLSRVSKIGVSGMFILGGFVIIASGLRIHFTLAFDPKDPTWSYVGLTLWSAVEMNVAVISCCLPTIRPAIISLMPESVKSRLARTSTQQLAEQRVYKFRNFGGHVNVTGTKDSDFIPL